MECQQTQVLFSEYIDKRLPQSSAQAIDMHLSACADCRLQVARLSQINKVYGTLPEVEPPLGFSTRLMAHLEEQPAKPQAWAWLSWPFQFTMPLQATAVVVVAVLAVFLYRQEGPLDHSPPTVVAQRPVDSIAPAAPTAPSPTTSSRTAEPAMPQTSNSLRALSTPRAQLPEPVASPRASRPFDSAGTIVGKSTVQFRVMVRLSTATRQEKTQGGPSAPTSAGFSTLSEPQFRSLEQARRRAVESGQAQNEIFVIARDRYERFKQELGLLGAVESAPARDDALADAKAKPADTVAVQVILISPNVPAPVAPSQPGAR